MGKHGLKELHLDKNRLGSEGMINLSKEMKNNTYNRDKKAWDFRHISIEYLNLSDNDIGEEAALDFCRGLVGFGDEDSKEKKLRVASTTGNPQIKHVILKGNDVGTDSVVPIELMLRNGGLKGLRTFDLSSTVCKPDIIHSINRYMHKNELEAQKPRS
jgi:hypothetical protein